MSRKPFTYWKKEDIDALLKYAEDHNSTYSVTHPKFWTEFSKNYFDESRSAAACQLKYLLVSGRAKPQIGKRRIPIVPKTCKSLFPMRVRGQKKERPVQFQVVPVREVVTEIENDKEGEEGKLADKISFATTDSGRLIPKKPALAAEIEVISVDEHDPSKKLFTADPEKTPSPTSGYGYTISHADIKLYKQMYNEIKRYATLSSFSEVKKIYITLNRTISFITTLLGSPLHADGYASLISILRLEESSGNTANYVKLVEFNVLNCHKSLKYYKLKYTKEVLLSKSETLESQR